MHYVFSRYLSWSKPHLIVPTMVKANVTDFVRHLVHIRPLSW
jgi:hypothetical protein